MDGMGQTQQVRFSAKGLQMLLKDWHVASSQDMTFLAQSTWNMEMFTYLECSLCSSYYVQDIYTYRKN